MYAYTKVLSNVLKSDRNTPDDATYPRPVQKTISEVRFEPADPNSRYVNPRQKRFEAIFLRSPE